MIDSNRFRLAKQILGMAPQANILSPEGIDLWISARESWRDGQGRAKTISEVVNEAQSTHCFTPSEVGILVAETRGEGRNPAMAGTAEIIASKLLWAGIRPETENSHRNDVYRPLARERFELDHRLSPTLPKASDEGPTGELPSWFDVRVVSDFYWKSFDHQKADELWLALFSAPEQVRDVALEQRCHLHMNALKVALGSVTIDTYESDRYPDRMFCVSWDSRRAEWVQQEVEFDAVLIKECIDVGNHYWNDYVMKGRVFERAQSQEIILGNAAPTVVNAFESAVTEVATLRRAAQFVLNLADLKQRDLQQSLRRFDIQPAAVREVMGGIALVSTSEAVYDYTRIYQSLTVENRAECMTTVGYDGHALAAIIKELGASPDIAAQTAVDPERVLALAKAQGINLAPYILDVPIKLNFASRERGPNAEAVQALDSRIERIIGIATTELVADMARAPTSAGNDGPSL